MPVSTRTSRRFRRHTRIRTRVSGTAARPRVSVFRSAAHIRVQLIDDVAGKTLVAVSDEQLKAIPKDAERTGKVAKAYAVGQALAENAKAKKITAVVFDRAGYRYHGRVRALAEGARAGGLTF